ncbi:MAG: beta-galactosidase [Planctomycetota bacterium]
MRLQRTTILLMLFVSALSANDVKVVEEVPLYTDRPAAGVGLRAWNMTEAERDGHIYLNEDCKGEPWAGLNLSPQEKGKIIVTLTDDWIKFGFLRYRINGLADPYGVCGPPCDFQVRLAGVERGYQRVRERFFADGKGIDSDPATWQEVFVPISYIEPKPDDKITAVSIQCVLKPGRAFAVDQVLLARYSGERQADRDEMAQSVAQPWVTWPDYKDLPDALKVDKNPIRFRDEKFVTADGRRAFLISPWGSEDQSAGLGIGRDGKIVDNFGLYDPKAQAFIYEQPLAAESMSRLGFNGYANCMHPDPWFSHLGYTGKHHHRPFPDEAFRRDVQEMKAPFYVDMVCFPWSLGKPAVEKSPCVPPDALHDGKEHWTPYRVIGKGKDLWLTMWRIYAKRYKDAGADVIFFEFMNEPAYLAATPDHRAEFIDWLKRRYGTLEKVNATWGTSYASWEEIQNFKKIEDNPGIFFDYDECLGDRFTDLIAEGRKAVEEFLPNTPAAVQTMGGYCLMPRDAIYLAKLIPHERAVLTPTGGGRWSRQIKNESPKQNTMEYGISESPIANDLLLDMSGPKMIVDNEMYLGPGQTRADLRNRWWKAVIVGLDGASWFAWSKRGWAWWKGKENIRREADLFPYSALIPYAIRADAIRGTLEFAQEMELVREYVLPKPWGPTPTIAMVYSWTNARWRNWERQLHDKSGDYHAAMKYLQWNFDMIPAHLATKGALTQRAFLVAGGMDHVEPELVALLTDYVKDGGTLLVGEGLMNRDLYGKPVAAEDLLGVKAKGIIADPLGALKNTGLPDVKLLPGEIVSRAGGTEIEPLPGTEVLCVDAKGRPMVTRKALGKGKVYYIAADLVGYPLAKLLAGIHECDGLSCPVEISDAATGQLAPNVLLSRRSYETHHAFLLMNMDEFPKHIRIRVRDLTGDWRVCDPLAGRELLGANGEAAWPAAQIADEGILYCLAGEGRGLLLLTRTPWAKTKLAPARATDAQSDFETALRSWNEARKKPSAPFTMDPSRAGYVDLRAAANATTENVVQDAKARWVGFPSTEPLVRTFAGAPFQIIRWDHNEMRGYVALKSAGTPRHPDAVRGIQVGARASRIFFLLTCGEGGDGETLGKVVIHYADGRSAELLLVIGQTIARLADRVERKGVLATGLVTSVGSAWHVAQWNNPSPDVAIASLDLIASPGASGTIVLVAATMEQ